MGLACSETGFAVGFVALLSLCRPSQCFSSAAHLERGYLFLARCLHFFADLRSGWKKLWCVSSVI